MNVRVNEDPYPNRGYLYNENGYHDGGEWLNNKEELYRWLDANVPFALASGRELMVTDNEDACILHVKDGKIVWPNESMTPPYGGVTS